ncbi:MAG: hypothetical protein M0Z61_12730 [Nitrospiraceae bacterium]|nr:hypothetical protein [Nitrospiraceae bacterium]
MESKLLNMILYPKETERMVMGWIEYIFYKGGGIVWIFAFAVLYLAPINMHIKEFGVASVILWGLLGLLLTVGTLFQLWWIPSFEQKIKDFQSQQETLQREQENAVDAIWWNVQNFLGYVDACHLWDATKKKELEKEVAEKIKKIDESVKNYKKLGK